MFEDEDPEFIESAAPIEKIARQAENVFKDGVIIRKNIGDLPHPHRLFNIEDRYAHNTSGKKNWPPTKQFDEGCRFFREHFDAAHAMYTSAIQNYSQSADLLQRALENQEFRHQLTIAANAARGLHSIAENNSTPVSQRKNREMLDIMDGFILSAEAFLGIERKPCGVSR
jgi:hypothetical protein